MSKKTVTYYVVEYGGSHYGYSRDPMLAAAALDRGKRRGVPTAKIKTTSSPVHGLKANVWLPPFDDGTWR